jgi:hypothetical protein
MGNRGRKQRTNIAGKTQKSIRGRVMTAREAAKAEESRKYNDLFFRNARKKYMTVVVRNTKSVSEIIRGKTASTVGCIRKSPAAVKAAFSFRNILAER